MSDFDNLRSSWRSIYNLCSNGIGGEHPKFITTTRTVFEGYEGLLIANERFTDGSKSGVADGGFQNDKLKFKGAMVSYDNAARPAWPTPEPDVPVGLQDSQMKKYMVFVRQTRPPTSSRAAARAIFATQPRPSS